MNRSIFIFYILILPVLLTSAKPDKGYYTETSRPQFHYTLENNNLGQPTGLFFRNNKYYIYFSCNVHGRLNRNNGMACATSNDLIHWEHNGPVYDIDFADSDTTARLDWCGSVILDTINSSGYGTTEEPPVIAFFTGKNNRQYLAHGTLNGNFEINKEPLGVGDGFCGSPKVFYHERTSKWIMVLTQRKEKSAEASKIFFYSSLNLKEWDLTSTNTGLPECSSLFCLKDENNREQWIFASANGKYILGDFDGKNFKPKQENQALDYGKSFHGLCVTEHNGKNIMINGMRGANVQNMPFAGQLGFPSELKLVSKEKSLKIIRTPKNSLRSIRKKGLQKTDKNIIPGLKSNPVSSIKGKELYLSTTIQLKSANQLVFTARKGKKTEGIQLIYDIQRLNKPRYDMVLMNARTKIKPMEGRKINLEVLIDRSSLEIFINDGEFVFSQITDKPDLGENLILSNSGGEIFIEDLIVDKALSIWEAYRDTKK